MTTTSIPLSRRRHLTGVLTAGFLALVVALLAPRTAPVDGSELSIYHELPPLLWAAVLVAVVTAKVVALLSHLGWTRHIAQKRFGPVEYRYPGIDQRTNRVQSNGGFRSSIAPNGSTCIT